MNFKFVVIINLFLLLGMNFSAYAKNIPPKLETENLLKEILLTEQITDETIIKKIKDKLETL